MRITYDPAKRAATLERRGLDFVDAQEVFSGVTVEFEDRKANAREKARLAPFFGI